MRSQVGFGCRREPVRVGTVQAEMPEVWGAGGAGFEPLRSRPEAETGDPSYAPHSRWGDRGSHLPIAPTPHPRAIMQS